MTPGIIDAGAPLPAGCPHDALRALSGGRCPIGCADVEPSSSARLTRYQVARQRRACRDSFAAFARGAWSIVEPTRALRPSVAFDAIAAALQEAGERGGRWAISCPPGVSKSILCSVIWPAWLLLRTDGARRVMAGSYSWDFATRDARRCRDLITSPWYRGLVGDAWSIRDDADRRDDYWTTAGGRRLITSVAGKSTGERVDVQLVDDALNAADTHSDAARKEAIRWITEVLPSRLDDPEHATRVLVGQRLHPHDPISVAVEHGWRHLVLPALATDTPCELRRDDGSLIWRDERAPGEPLFDLLGVDALAQLKGDLGSAAFAAQYQQAPVDAESAMFQRLWLTRRWTELPRFDRVVVALDASFKESRSSDFAVIQVWGAAKEDRYLVEQWRKRAGFSETLAALRSIARRYRGAKVLIESAANGHAIFDQVSREIAGVVEVKPEGGKVARAASVQSIVERGVVVLPAHAPWLDAWVDEVSGFECGAKHDDQVDAMVYALRELQGSSASARMRMLLDMSLAERGMVRRRF